MKLILRSRAVESKVDPRLKFMTVDPGIGGTGVAIWSEVNRSKLVPPTHSCSIKSMVKDTWENEIASIAAQFRSLVQLTMPTIIYFELPVLMNSAVGAVASQRGDLVKLSIAAGALIGAGFGQVRKFESVGISAWKGQLKKSESTHRILERLPRGYFAPYYKPTSHEIDAIGIGLHVKGCL